MEVNEIYVCKYCRSVNPDFYHDPNFGGKICGECGVSDVFILEDLLDYLEEIENGLGTFDYS